MIEQSNLRNVTLPNLLAVYVNLLEVRRNAASFLVNQPTNAVLLVIKEVKIREQLWHGVVWKVTDLILRLLLEHFVQDLILVLEINVGHFDCSGDASKDIDRSQNGSKAVVKVAVVYFSLDWFGCGW